MVLELDSHGFPKTSGIFETIKTINSQPIALARHMRRALDSARSLGLTSGQTMRFVVLPQAIRRVVPPLLNDFVSLLKDTGLVSILGVTDAVRAAQINASRTFNYTPYVVAAILFLLITIPMTRYTDRAIRQRTSAQNSEGAI